ncbi:hypothetical protein Zmor_010521 [Zophobas morio]|uniref:CCD97-like C-terminal domain-containing protein n=1 Tax=Zophobas morio TaxID=2755281 RepID=A0AA38IL11_9CUCU|nr:hypothetical protein Zmor_010521 [Zophobas morio]
MTMEVEIDQPEGSAAEIIDKDQIIDFLTNNETICFKSQQRGEDDLSKQEKTNIALEIYNKSKLNFLVRFGKYLQRSQLDFFQQFTQNCEESDEINIVLKNHLETVVKKKQVNVKNRRYEALKEMIREDSYFSEIEMMKRNPLLYDQLVGQYMTEEEREERDRININENSTLVKVLMEGIERDNAQVKRKKQEEYEDEVREEEESNSDDEMSTSPKSPKITHVQWGEFLSEPTAQSAKKAKTKHVAPEEQRLLKEEFVSTMYQDFLDGKDDDFDYDSVDNNEKYDNNEMVENDEEEKYFDAEEPETVPCSQSPEESEDELDIFMSGLNQHPGVSQLSKDIQKL